MVSIEIEIEKGNLNFEIMILGVDLGSVINYLSSISCLKFQLLLSSS